MPSERSRLARWSPSIRILTRVYRRYGPGNMVEGNFTKGSKQQKEREAAAKQGEK